MSESLMPGQASISNRCFRRLTMFDGKNNRMLDSFSFRTAVTVGAFLAWFGAGYLLLTLA